MKHLAEFLAVTTVLVTWNFGIVIASGFWSTTFAICVPPYAWYLLAERTLKLMGWSDGLTPQPRASQLKEMRMKCRRCNGSGWVWWTEMDHYIGPAIYSGIDDTQYSCPICDGSGISTEPERCPNTGDLFDEDDDEQYHPDAR